MTKEFTPGKTPRGIRLNNPGNIRITKEEWRGADPNGEDKDFVTFTSAQYGIRAIAKIIRNYNKKYNLTTPKEIINRWAPPNENDTESYVKHVADRLGVSENAPIDLENPEVMVELVKAIIAHENGPGLFYDDFTIQQGVEMA